MCSMFTCSSYFAASRHARRLLLLPACPESRQVWDTRQGVEAPAWANRKAHTAGVCCVSSSPYQEHVVATGSYDERARLWDLRSASRPLQVAEVRRVVQLLFLIQGRQRVRLALPFEGYEYTCAAVSRHYAARALWLGS